MKVQIGEDELYPYYFEEKNPGCGFSVDIPPKVWTRYKQAKAEFDRARNHLDAAINRSVSARPKSKRRK